MIIETVSNPEHDVEIKFKDLELGVVFEFGDDNGGDLGKALKLEQNKYVMLTYASGNDWFAIGDGSMVKHYKIAKVWGRLVGLKVQL